YTVKLTVSNANGSDSETKTGYITVTNTRIKDITFENGDGSNNLTDPTTGADSTAGTVSLETSAPLDGGFSATIPNVASSYLEENFSAADDIYVSFILRISAIPGSTARIALLSNAGSSVAILQVLTDGRLQLRDSVANATVGTSTIALTPGQTYHIGLHQRKGSGSNAVLEAYVVAGAGPFGTTPPFASKTTGTWTTPADRLRVGATNTVAVNATFDDIKLDTAILPN
ncbi:MAG TPA: hypothetical protein VGJ87_09405, partial [Roseiflexaceae bacterium]